MFWNRWAFAEIINRRYYYLWHLYWLMVTKGIVFMLRCTVRKHIKHYMKHLPFSITNNFNNYVTYNLCCHTKRNDAIDLNRVISLWFAGDWHIRLADWSDHCVIQPRKQQDQCNIWLSTTQQVTTQLGSPNIIFTHFMKNIQIYLGET